MANKIERVWIDVETTGLVAANEVMLELGIGIGDRWGNIFEGESWIIRDTAPDWQKALQRGWEDPFIKDMHTKSGLWRDMERLNVVANHSTKIVEQAALDWLDDHDIQHGKFPTSGNNVGFDREFLAVHMPKLNSHFHYRKIDVSTLKELCRDLNPRVFEQAPKKNEMHRAYPDILESAEEYKFYVENFLWTD